MSKNKKILIIITALILGEGIGFVYFANQSVKFRKKTVILNEQINKLTEEKEALSSKMGVIEKISKDLTKKLEDKDINYAKDLKDKPIIEKEYKELLEKFEEVKKDRENILIQTKRLIQENNKLKELEKSFEENKNLEVENKKLKEKIATMEIEFKEIKNSRVIFSDECNKDDESIGRKLREEFARLQKGYSVLGSSLIQSSNKREKRQSVEKDEKLNDSEISKSGDEGIGNEISEKFYSPLHREFKKFKGMVFELKQEKNKAEEAKNKLKVEMEKLVIEKNKAEEIIEKEKEKTTKIITKIKELEMKYKGALKINKDFQKKIKNVPRKFSVIAKQNEMLLRETATMHYNLGVFYTKNKEYEKAIIEYKKALDIRPKDANAYFNLGYIYAERFNDRDKAIDCFRSFLRLAHNDDTDIEWAKKY
ncbi:MAG: tetratricopeptide repeat protein, partial [Candidatus Omnitrophica bacterium]|nr:tetratricopeptide repeat protein [Candidatus Omnitrophota bacterium]